VTTDPICGMTVDESSAVSLELQGKTWFFCCDGCRQKFQQAGSSQASTRSADVLPGCCEIEPVGAQFYCPMCEDVVSEPPGACASCGMALEVRSVQAGRIQDDTELNGMSQRLAVALLFGVPVFLLSMAPMVGVPIERWLSGPSNLWAQFVLSTVVVLWCGLPFFQRAPACCGNRAGSPVPKDSFTGVHRFQFRHRARCSRDCRWPYRGGWISTISDIRDERKNRYPRSARRGSCSIAE